jgi:hypothetical protein
MIIFSSVRRVDASLKFADPATTIGSSERGADTLALSFRMSYPYGQIRENLVELRSRDREDNEI